MPFWKRKKEEENPYTPYSAPAPAQSGGLARASAAPADGPKLECPQCHTIFNTNLGVCPTCHRPLTSDERASAAFVAKQTLRGGYLGAEPGTEATQINEVRTQLTRGPDGRLQMACPSCRATFPVDAGRCPNCRWKLPPGYAKGYAKAFAEAEKRAEELAAERSKTGQAGGKPLP